MTSARSPLFALAFILGACGAESLVDTPAEPAPVPQPADAATEPSRPSASSSSGSRADAAVTPVLDAGSDAPPEPAEPVRLRVLSYNVAGLPQGVSGSNPAVNTPRISPLLEPFDLVLVQEDFTYHTELVASVTHPYQSQTVALADRSDGLNLLSRAPFSDFARTAWNQCNGHFDQGSDCLTKKGFSRAVLDLGAGRRVDVYDVHFDAGRSEADQAARRNQAQQLAAAIAQTSRDHAVLVAGDTNMRAADEATFAQLLSDTGLACACRALACPEPVRIDRVLYRSGEGATLTPLTYALAPGFVDAEGAPLSDHEPVHVDLDVR